MLTATMPVRVYIEDTDASGVVYHANYLRWFERGRSEWLRAAGFGQRQLHDQDGVSFTVADIAVRFVLPARLDDALEVQTTVDRRRSASIQFKQSVSRVDDGAVLAQADTRVACVDAATFKPCALPPRMQTGES